MHRRASSRGGEGLRLDPPPRMGSGEASPVESPHSLTVPLFASASSHRMSASSSVEAAHMKAPVMTETPGGAMPVSRSIFRTDILDLTSPA